jgi:hypothetical protein
MFRRQGSSLTRVEWFAINALPSRTKSESASSVDPVQCILPLSLTAIKRFVTSKTSISDFQATFTPRNCRELLLGPSQIRDFAKILLALHTLPSMVLGEIAYLAKIVFGNRWRLG